MKSLMKTENNDPVSFQINVFLFEINFVLSKFF